MGQEGQAETARSRPPQPRCALHLKWQHNSFASFGRLTPVWASSSIEARQLGREESVKSREPAKRTLDGRGTGRRLGLGEGADYQFPQNHTAVIRAVLHLS